MPTSAAHSSTVPKLAPATIVATRSPAPTPVAAASSPGPIARIFADPCGGSSSVCSDVAIGGAPFVAAYPARERTDSWCTVCEDRARSKDRDHARGHHARWRVPQRRVTMVVGTKR